jgi:hypothetical protein
VFEGFKRRLAEKNARDTLQKAKDGIASLSRLDPPMLYFARSGLTNAHEGLVDQFGPFETWNRQTRTAAMSQLMKTISAAQKTRGSSISDQATVVGSFGAQILFFYYDSIDMIEPTGSEIRNIISNWADFETN